MSEVIGLSFQPGVPQEDARSAANRTLPPAGPIQTLSLQVPRFVGARSPVSPALLTAGGSEGLSPLLQQMLRRAVWSFMGTTPATSGVFAPSAATGGPLPGSPAFPLPRVGFLERPADTVSPTAVPLDGPLGGGRPVPTKTVPESRYTEIG